MNASAPRFIKLDEANNELPADAATWSYVRDEKTGLVWTASAMSARMNWKDALAAPASLGSDWRLPTIEELLSLVDYSRFDPAIDANFFRDVPKDGCWWFWSSSPDASSPSGCAWGVNFNDGNSDYSNQNNQGLVRPVRSVSARQ